MENKYLINQELTIAPQICGDVLVCCTEKNIYGLNIYDMSSLTWSIPISSEILTISCRGSLIFVMGKLKDFKHSAIDEELSLVVLDAGTGNYIEAWDALNISIKAEINKKQDNTSVRELMIVEDVLMVFDNLGNIYGYDIGKGNIPKECLWYIGGDELTAGKAGIGDRAVFYVAGDKLNAVNAKSGGKRWEFPNENNPMKPDDLLLQDIAPMLGNGMAIVQGNDAIYALNITTGEMQWTVESNNEIFNRPAISWEGNLMFITSQDNNVYAYELSSGDIIWKSDYSKLLKNREEKSGSFLEPIINLDVVENDIISGRLIENNYIFIPHSGGDIFILEAQLETAISNGMMDFSTTIKESEEIISVENGIMFTPSIANGSLFACNSVNEIWGITYIKNQNYAAYFDRKSFVRIPPKDELNFGKNNFSVEMWIRTSTEGELLTSIPKNNDEIGFQLSIASSPQNVAASDPNGQGKIQFTTFDGEGNVLTFSESQNTYIDDGTWHHLALVRKRNEITIFEDGISIPVTTIILDSLISTEDKNLLSNDREYFALEEISGYVETPNVGSNNQEMIIGNSGNNFAKQEKNEGKFQGLIADVRVWNTDITANQIKDRMSKLLSGIEDGLALDVPLNNSNSKKYKDIQVQEGRYLETNGVRALTTNFELDDSLYPYLLPNAKYNWPYSSRWTVKGEDAPVSIPIRCGQNLCFQTDNYLYCIDLAHGTRKWALEQSNISSPISDGNSIYILEGTKVIAIEPETGLFKWVVNLKSLDPFSGEISENILPPSITEKYVICSADRKNIYWIDKYSGEVKGYFKAANGIHGEIQVQEDKVYFLADDKFYQFVDFQFTNKGIDKVEYTLCCDLILQKQGNNIPQILVDSKWAFIYDCTKIVKLEILDKVFNKNIPWNPPIENACITGMTASLNANRLVYSCSDGSVHFIEYSSGKEIKKVLEDGMSYCYAPVIYKDNVYCTKTDSERITGGIFVYGIQNADVHGVEKSAAPVSAPYVDNCTTYFGVDDEGKGDTGMMGEALHSVVFGNSYSLELNAEDTDIKIIDDKNIFARELEDETNCFNDGNFSIETWINSEKGSSGEVISMANSIINGKEFSGFSVYLNVDGSIDGKILSSNEGSQYTSNPVPWNDGNWHHLAVVFKRNEDNNQQLCYMYLDGKPLIGVKYSSVNGQTPEINRSVVIGGTKNSKFTGLIQSIRVWETWLHADEVNERRSIMLMENEPDILVDWGFCDTGIIDKSRNKLNHTKDLKIWLTDLNFEMGYYPYMIAESKGLGTTTQILPDEHGTTITTAEYKTTILLKNGDSSPREKSRLKVWSSEDIILDGKPIKKKECIEKDVNFGKQELIIKCNNLKYSPTLWIWADFMYENERFHVSPVQEVQSNIIIPPPRLIAQSDMMQDYNYCSGDELGVAGSCKAYDHIDITTVRTTITAQNSDGNPMKDEIIEIFAEDHVDIEIDGINYHISPENSVTAKTGAEGSVAIVFHEEAKKEGNLINIPNLSVRAGFMSHSSRFIIRPTEKIHETMSNLNGDKIQGKEKLYDDQPSDHKVNLLCNLNEKINSVEQEKSNKLIKDLQKQIDKLSKEKQTDEIKEKIEKCEKEIEDIKNKIDNDIKEKMDKSSEAVANAMNHLMSMATQPQNKSNSRRARLKKRYGDDISADYIQGTYSSAFLNYNAPITTEYAPAPHFVLSFNEEDNSFSYNAFDSMMELDAHFDGLGISPFENSCSKSSVQNGIFDKIGDIFKGIGHAFEKAWKEFKHVAVKTWDEIKKETGEIIHHVEVAIVNAASAVTKFVIKTVKDVVNHLVALLKNIWVIIKDIYYFFRAIFDWKRIIEIHDVIKDAFKMNIFDGLRGALKTTIPDSISKELKNLKVEIKPFEGCGGIGNKSINSIAKGSKGLVNICTGATKCLKAQYLLYKVFRYGKSIKIPTPDWITKSEPEYIDKPFGTNNFLVKRDELNKDFYKLFNDIFSITNQSEGIAGLSLNEIINLLNDVLKTAVDVAEDISLGLIGYTGVAIDQIEKMLNKEFQISFVSQLYKLITGNTIKFIDILCLIPAVPINISMELAKVKFNKGEIKEVLKLTAPFANQSLSSNADGERSEDVVNFFDVCYIVFTIVYGIIASVLAVLQGAENMEDPSGTHQPSQIGETNEARYVVELLSSFTACMTGLFQQSMRDCCDSDWRKLDVYIFIVMPIIYMALIKFSSEKVSFGRITVPSWASFASCLEKVPVCLIKSLVGLISVGLSVYNIAAKSSSGSEKQNEYVINLMSNVPNSFEFLIWRPISVATEGISIGTLSGLYLFINSIMIPKMHLDFGYGKSIW